MTGGHPRKRKRNTLGLHHGQQSSAVMDSPDDFKNVSRRAKSLENDDTDLKIQGQNEMSGLKLDFKQEYKGGSTDELDVDEDGELEAFSDEEFGQRLVKMAAKEDDKDLDWIPKQLWRKLEKCAAERKCECI